MIFVTEGDTHLVLQLSFLPYFTVFGQLEARNATDSSEIVQKSKRGNSLPCQDVEQASLV